MRPNEHSPGVEDARIGERSKHPCRGPVGKHGASGTKQSGQALDRLLLGDDTLTAPE